MKRSNESIARSKVRAVVLLVLGAVLAGCGATTEQPVVSGRRVQNAEVVAHGSPIQLSTYELGFVRVVVHEGSGDVALIARR